MSGPNNTNFSANPNPSGSGPSKNAENPKSPALGIRRPSRLEMGHGLGVGMWPDPTTPISVQTPTPVELGPVKNRKPQWPSPGQWKPIGVEMGHVLGVGMCPGPTTPFSVEAPPPVPKPQCRAWKIQNPRSGHQQTIGVENGEWSASGDVAEPNKTNLSANPNPSEPGPTENCENPKITLAAR